MCEKSVRRCYVRTGPSTPTHTWIAEGYHIEELSQLVLHGGA